MQERDAEDRRRFEAATATQAAATTEAAKPSPAELQREEERKGYFDWKAKGDFRSPPPSLMGMSFGPEAERRRAMERTALPTGSGAMGAGYASPTAMALNRDYLSNVNAENDALAYQGQLQGEDLYQRTNNSQGIIANDMARKNFLMGGSNFGLSSAANQSQYSTGARINTQPKSLWPALISGGLSAAGMFLGGPAFGAMMGGAGGGAMSGRGGPMNGTFA